MNIRLKITALLFILPTLALSACTPTIKTAFIQFREDADDSQDDDVALDPLTLGKNKWLLPNTNSSTFQFDSSGNLYTFGNRILSKHSSSGALQWSKRLETRISQPVMALAASNVVVTGTNDFPVSVYDLDGNFVTGISEWCGVDNFFCGDNISALTVDSSNKIYVGDEYNASIRVFDLTGTLLQSALFFNGSSQGCTDADAIGVDPTGKIYVECRNNMNRFASTRPGFEVFSSAGAYLTSVDLTTSTIGKQVSGPKGLYVEDANTFYGTGYDSGPLTFSKIDASGTASYINYSNAGPGWTLYSNANWLTLYAGDLYMMGWVPSSAGDSVFGLQSFVASSGAINSDQKISSGSQTGEFLYPSHVAVSSDKKILVSDNGNHRVQLFDRSGTHLLTLGGVDGSNDGEFSNNGGVAFDSSGNIYVVDLGNNRIQKFDSSGNYLLQFDASDGTIGGFSFQRSSVNASGIAIDSSDMIYVADQGNAVVQMFNTNGSFVGVAAGSEVSCPTGVAIDSNDQLFVTDRCSQAVYKYASGTLALSATIDFSVHSADPFAVAVTADGHTFVTASEKIFEFDASGTHLQCYGKYGSADEQFFTRITGFVVDSAENFYVTDLQNNRVVRFPRTDLVISNCDIYY